VLTAGPHPLNGGKPPLTARSHPLSGGKPALSRGRAWWTLLCFGPALLIVGVPAAVSVDLGAAEHVTLLRLVSTTLALGAAFTLNDPAARTTAVAPTSRAARHAAWLTQAVVINTVWWSVALLITARDTTAEDWRQIPASGLTLEALTLFTAAVAAAAWLRSVSQGRPGQLAGPALLAIVAAMIFLPRQADFFLQPGDTRWAATHRIWSLLLLASAVAFWLASREPAGRRSIFRRRP
jgi:hypothetical protein